MLAGWSLFELRPTLPEQDRGLSLPQITQLEEEIETAPEGDPIPITESETLEPPRVLYPERPITGEKVGTLWLPTLDESWPIYEGTADAQLNRGVGHYTKSVLPGVRDNSVLSGHRTTVFNRLGELEVGHLIFVSTSAGDFTYRVRGFQIVERTSREIIVPTPTAVLTLTTCYPFNSIGRTTDAFIVTADLVSSRYSNAVK